MQRYERVVTPPRIQVRHGCRREPLEYTERRNRDVVVMEAGHVAPPEGMRMLLNAPQLKPGDLVPFSDEPGTCEWIPVIRIDPGSTPGLTHKVTFSDGRISEVNNSARFDVLRRFNHNQEHAGPGTAS